MQQRFQEALCSGGDHVVAALGYVQNDLAQHPEDPRGTAYKGALLVLQAASSTAASSRLGYIRVGVAMVENALSAVDDTALVLPEMRYLAGVTLLLAQRLLQDQDVSRPREILDDLISMQRFDELEPLLRIDAILCRHLLDGSVRGGPLMDRALGIDYDLCKRVLNLRVSGTYAVTTG